MLDPDPDPLVRGADPDPNQKVTDPKHWSPSDHLLCTGEGGAGGDGSGAGGPDAVAAAPRPAAAGLRQAAPGEGGSQDE
jgi:hypothetical protein